MQRQCRLQSAIVNSQFALSVKHIITQHVGCCSSFPFCLEHEVGKREEKIFSFTLETKNPDDIKDSEFPAQRDDIKRLRDSSPDPHPTPQLKKQRCERSPRSVYRIRI
ncbi:hypothetical protein H920_15434 [Fukomys damarensis]|uniref:Uncharacterized protein n=1 Tax=Fukomys damarensis TaxID=885580 RepID=A0A091CUP3_FUKDA|nr:hypothetical protein H920_15434 [Fukomys damarensis]